MELLCCFKIVPDYEKVVSRDWLSAPLTGPDVSYVPRIISCFDEAGLEAALRLKDSAEKCGVSAAITAITVGSGSYDYFFRSLFAAGVQHIIQVPIAEPSAFSPGEIAEAICSNLPQKTFDAIICGARSADSCLGAVPYLLAKRLGLPCLPNVLELGCHQQGISALWELERGTCSAVVSTPAVYAVGNSPHPYLRMATVKKRLAAANLSPLVAQPFCPCRSGEEPFELLKLSPRRSSRSCIFIEGDDCLQKAQELLKLCPEVKSL